MIVLGSRGDEANMIVTMHQPEHLIWLGLVDKISKSDTFVVLDNVQFRKNYYQNRNKIRNRERWVWLTVPIKKHSLNTKIIDIEISYNQKWQEKYFTLLKLSYKDTKYFEKYFPDIKKIIDKKYKYLSDLNIDLIKFILKCFGIKKRIIKSSDLDLGTINSGGSDVVLKHCLKLGTKKFLSGQYGKDYLKLDDFKKNGIKVIFHKFKHPVYHQLAKPFIPEMSSIDLLFNYGPESKKILKIKK